MALNPRQRRQAFRLGMYTLAVALLVIALLFADWGRIQRNFFNVAVMRSMSPEVITIAARNTLLYTAIAFTFGLVLALLLALMRISTIRPYRALAIGYIELFRGLPALVTLILVGFGLPIAFGPAWNLGTLWAGSIGLTIVAGAYMAETIRAGIEAVPRGQMEAARSLGMSRSRAMVSIVLPQAFRIIIPPLTNELVLLIKDTSLFFVLGATPFTRELTSFARYVLSLRRNGTPLTVIAVVYLMITLPLTALVRRLERRTARAR